VVIVEAARRSGSLITARQAGEQGREVMAVPGHPLDPRAEGTNQLLKDGATLVTGPEDVLAALGPMLPRRTQDVMGAYLQDGSSSCRADPAPTPPVNDSVRKLVVDALGPAPVNVDELARATGLPISSVKVALLELTLAGRIEQHGSQLVSLRV
jgi:DNA processing protein